MAVQLVVIGAGSCVGRMLKRLWHGRNDVRWVSRTGPLSWDVDDGAAALRPHLEGAGAVLCLAGSTPSSGTSFDLNKRIATAVVDSAADTRPETRPRVLLASSQAVYGGGAGPFAEGHTPAPLGAYGVSKLEMEVAARARADAEGVELTLLRLGNVVGADMLGRNIAAGRVITLDQFGDGRTPRRSYVDPVRLAVTLEALAAHRAGLPKVLNLAAAPPLEMGPLAEAMGARVTHRAAPPTALPRAELHLGRLEALVPGATGPVGPAEAAAAWRQAVAP